MKIKDILKVNNDSFIARVTLVLLMAIILVDYIFIKNSHIPEKGSQILFSIAVVAFLIDIIKVMIESLSIKTYQKGGKEDLSKVTVIIPTYNGESTVGVVIKNLLKRFKKDQIIIASNGSNDKTCEIAEKLGVRVLNVKDPLGKVKAINYALKYVNTPYILILDDDTLINNASIPTNILDKGYDAVAFRVMPKIDGWLSVLQAYEYRKSMEIGRAFHNKTATVQNVSGAIGLFRTEELLRQQKLHTCEFSGEDLQRTLLIHLSDEGKGVVISNALIETFVPQTLYTLLRQRVYGWNPGSYSNLKRYLKLLFKKNVPLRLKFDVFYYAIVVTLLDPLRVITLPALFLSPLYFLRFYFAYVLIELVPYAKTGRKEPIWVVLLTPAYGLFNFFCRMIAYGVFIYRRIAFHLGRKYGMATEYDHYKFVTNKLKMTSNVIAVNIVTFTFVLYGTIVNYGSISLGHKSVVQAAEIITIAEVVNDKKIIEYKYVAQSGDSLWSLSEKALENYLDSKAELKTQNKNALVKGIVDNQAITHVYADEEYSVFVDPAQIV